MLIKRFMQQIKINPNKLAIKTNNKSYSYKALNKYSTRVAMQILEKKQKIVIDNRKKTIGLLLGHTADMIIAMLGVLKSDNIYVPLDSNYPLKRLAYMLSDSEAKYIITNNKNLDLAVKLENEICDNDIEIINIDTLDKNIEVKDLELQTDSNDLAYILYTSGSTGKPKGVMQTHENIIYFIDNYKRELSITNEDNMTLFSSFSHDGAVMDVYGALLNGATLFLLDVKKESNFLSLSDWIYDNNITIWHSVPTLFRYFVRKIKNGSRLDSLRFIVLGGEAVLRKDIDMFQKIFNKTKLYNLYGQTESSFNCGQAISTQDDVNKILIGAPISDTSILVVDENGFEVDPFEVGEIFIASKYVSPGYWRDDELTSKVFVESQEFERIYKTGDLGRLLLDGSIEFIGRKDFQTKIRGYRVELGEIEGKLLGYEDITDAVVIPMDNEKGEKNLYAYMVVKKEVVVSELRAYLSNELPDYMIPSQFIKLDKIPLTQSGKTDRKSLINVKGTLLKLGSEYIIPQTNLEKIIAKIWREELGREKVGINDNFFDLGGNSLNIVMVNNKLNNLLKKEIPVVRMFEYPTIKSLAEYISKLNVNDDNIKNQNIRVNRVKTSNNEIAVIGLAGRFPGAKNVKKYWENLQNGVESVSFFTAEELVEEGIDKNLIDNSNYVKAKGVLEDIEYFDALFFDYLPNDAKMMDPQMRFFHECAWEALEDSGYVPDVFNGSIGLYCGAMSNVQWQALNMLSDDRGVSESFSARHFFDKDYLSTRVSYKLNLKGPSYVVQTACSTSLASINIACKDLQTGECDMALAGGASITLPKKSGYMYQQGMILSKDGHCRAFDEKASGTVFGDGIGVVVLKRLEDAIADGDNIYAVIKGNATNNDGLRKVGYTAPSIEGQIEVIKNAQYMAGVEAESISYIETHGTGTSLGDPIEIEALNRAFNTDKNGFCAIGSVKTNIGHLNIAAGIAGFIKTVLALNHRKLPPSLHFKKPNPNIDFENSPFYVNAEAKEWKNDKYPLRAGVSSFGIGGTNAHIVLEEAPKPAKSIDKKDYKIITISAKTKSALDNATINLIEYLKENHEINLADVAYTYQIGRKDFANRRMLVCSDVDEAINDLTELHPRKVYTGLAEDDKKYLVFMFTGQGSQYINMGLDLYKKEQVFHEEMHKCFEILESILECDVKEFIYPNKDSKEIENKINETNMTQPILFSFEYALAKQLLKWGIKPDAMIGHSLGEYVEACIAGVFSLEEALKLVVIRGKLMQEMPKGSMMSVELSEKELNRFIDRDVSIAAINGETKCVVSGPFESIDRLKGQLNERGYKTKLLKTSHAFHSNMMTPMLEQFEEEVRKVNLNKAQIPYISNITGTWITEAEVTKPKYWVKHLRESVRFNDGVNELLKKENAIFIEVGPGRALSTFVRQNTNKKPNQEIINTIRHPNEKVLDDYYLLDKIGRLWAMGIKIDWTEFYNGEKRQRISLPTYPFERKRYWVEDENINNLINKMSKKSKSDKKNDMEKWFYIPWWERALKINADNDGTNNYNLLIFNDELGLGLKLIKDLEDKNINIVRVNIGYGFRKNSEKSYTINPCEINNYNELFMDLEKNDILPDKIVHLWNIANNIGLGFNDIAYVDNMLNLGLYSLINISKVIGNLGIAKNIQIDVIANNIQQVIGDDIVLPERATILGAIKNIPFEYLNIDYRLIDIDLINQGKGEAYKVVEKLTNEILSSSDHNIIAYRGSYRWIQTMKPVKLHELKDSLPKRLREEGVYLVTGGLGGIGLTLAKYLAKSVKARLVLIGRSDFPPKSEWEKWIETNGQKDKISKKIEDIKEMESYGAQVLILKADVTDFSQMDIAIQKAKERFGSINGVIHSAGIADFAGAVQKIEKNEIEKVLASKVKGTISLDKALNEFNLDFFVLCSSLWSILPAFGQVSYCAANSFLDAFANYKNSISDAFVLSINWDTWKEIGMSVDAERKRKKLSEDSEFTNDKDGLLILEGVEAFERILNNNLPQVAISSRDLEMRIKEIKEYKEIGYKKITSSENLEIMYERPKLSTEYMEPKDEIEAIIASIWSYILGIEKIGIYDDFFELGGDSLKAITVCGKLHEVLKIEVQLAEIFNNPTIADLVKHIKSKKGIKKDISEIGGDLKEGITKKEITKDLENLHKSFPLTNVQRAYLVGRSDQFELGGVSTHSYSEYEMIIDINRLNKAFNKLIERHEMLRAVITEDGKQRILEEIPHYKIKIEDISDINKLKQNERIEKERERMSHHIFKTDSWPLFEIKAFKLTKDIYYLCVGIDLLIVDAASLRILGNELLEFYEKPELKLPEIEISFRDYVVAYNEVKNSDAYKKSKGYWIDKLMDFPPAPALPLKCDPKDIDKPRFKRKSKSFNKSDLAKLKEYTRKNNITMSGLLCTAYANVLSYWSNQSELAVNVTVFNRYPFHKDVDKIIGDFTSVILLDINLQKDTSFLDKAKYVQSVLVKALDNRMYDGVEFLREISRYNNLGTQAVMPIVFTSVVSDIEGESDIMENFTSKERIIDSNINISQTSQVFLDNQVAEREGKLVVTWDYVEDIFESSIIDYMFNQYIEILSIIVNNERVDYIIEPSKEDKELIEAYNKTEENIESVTLQRLFKEQVKKTPEKVAIEYEKEKITYIELDKKSNQVARYLIDEGVNYKDLVAVVADRSIGTIINVLGVLKTGAAYVPIDEKYPKERREYITSNSNCKVIINPDLYMKKQLRECSEKEVMIDCSIDNLAYVIYTSGSTGRPKGVMIDHKAAVNTILDINRKFNVEETDKIIGVSSMSFDLSVYDVFGALSTGATLVIIDDQRDVKNLINTINEKQITIWNSVPAIMDILTENIEKELKDNQMTNMKNTSLRLVLLSGDWIPVSLPDKIRKHYPKAQIISLGGATEASIWSIYYPINEVDSNWASIPYGRPLANQNFYVLNEDRQICPVGVTGELYIGGVGVALGYMNDEEKTKKSFIDDENLGRIYRTGDYGRLTKKGYIGFLGRKDNQVKIGGYRIELGEIEGKLIEHAKIRNAVVIDRVNELGKKYLCAYIVSQEEWTIGELRDYLMEKLPEYMVPSYYIKIDEVPLTSNGKVNRRELPEPKVDREALQKYYEPRNEVEEKLVEIWKDILEVYEIGIADDFFELGGDSFKIQHLANDITNEFIVKIPLKFIFNNPTIDKLAKYIQEEKEKNETVEARGDLRKIVSIDKAKDVENLYKPFQLTNVQSAYLVGRSSQFELGGVSTHGYSEYELKINIDRFNSAFNKLIRRHEMLRAVVTDDGKQRILEDIPNYQIKVEDISNADKFKQNERIEKERKRMSHHIFKTDKWPLFEIKAFKLTEDIYYLCIGIDLLIIDAASLQILGKELIEVYEKPDEPLEDIGFSFRDYVLAYKELKKSNEYKKAKKYWMGKLEDFPTAPALPLKCNPKDIEKPRFKRKAKSFRKVDMAKLKEYTRKNNITMSGLLCTAYANVLSYWSNQRELAINVTVFNRYPFNKDVTKIIGDFTSVLLLGIDFKGDMGFKGKAKHVQNVLAEALDNKIYDGVEFIRDISRYNNLGTKTVMPIVFTSVIGNDEYKYEVKEDLFNQEKIINSGSNISQTSQVFLDNRATEWNGELVIAWDYVEDIFEESVIESMFNQYIDILNSIVNNDKTEYVMMPAKEDLALVKEYNNTKEDINIETLQVLFKEQVEKTPEKVAIEYGKQRVTYRELDNKSNQVARYLINEGVKYKDLVAIVADRSIDTIINVLGVLKTGAAYVPIDEKYPEDRREYISSNSSCKMIIKPDLYDRQRLESYSEQDIMIDSTIDDLAYVIYTSGSTGRPKGVMIDHKSAANTILDINKKFNVGEKDRIIGVSSMSFDLSVYDMFGALSTGATLVIIKDQRDVENLTKTIEEKQITIWNSVPAIMDIVTENIEKQIQGNDRINKENTSLRLVLLSGDWIPVNLPNRIKSYYVNAEVISLGGATEASIWSIYYPINEVDSNWASIPYGRPLANQNFYVLNEDRQICPVGVTGELYIGGVGVALGYMNDEEKTKKSFIDDKNLGKIYRTGDYGRLTKKGYIEFLGRKDNQVKIGGYRIELGEIEAKLIEHAKIRNAVVIDRVNELGKKYLCAYIVSQEEWTIGELRDYLMEKLPEYMVPSYYIKIDEVPLTSNGKVNRRELPEPKVDREALQKYYEPRNEVEEKLVEIWKDILEVDEIGIEDDFFELGGDSFKIQHLANDIAKQFKVNIKITDLFSLRKIINIAEYINKDDFLTNTNDQVAISEEVSDKEKIDESNIYYWSPAIQWKKVENKIRIGDVSYSGIASYVFPKLYFITQEGIGLDDIFREFSMIDENRLGDFIQKLIQNKVLVNSILSLKETVNLQNKIYESQYGDEIYYDEQAYNKFKNHQLNRSLSYDKKRKINLEDYDTGIETIENRKTHRSFDENKKIAFNTFSHLISVFKQNKLEDETRYYYASAGGLYPIDIYIYVKENRVEDLERGLYYYNPMDDKLILVSNRQKITKHAYGYGNRSIFESSAFSIYLIYNADVSMPKYGSMGYIYACVDTGIMVGTLTQISETKDIGLCSIGDMDFESLKKTFKLSDNQIFMHAIELGLKLEEE